MSRRRDDQERQTNLEVAGYTFVEVWEAQVWHRPEEVGALLRVAIERACARRAA